MKNKTSKKIKGFTLLEILLVIAAIGILAAIVLVAINPNRQIAQVRNADRRSDVNTLYKAIEQYLIDKGNYPEGITTTDKKDICNTGTEQVGGATDCTNKADLRVLVPTYLAAIPTDPSGGAYKVSINTANNRLSILASSSELGQLIFLNEYTYATGGDLTYYINVSGLTYRVHEFRTVGISTFNVIKGGEFEYLVVAGGGGGGYGGAAPGGGGGAGGVITNVGLNPLNLSANTFEIIVGEGGVNSDQYIDGNNGGNSSAFSLVAIGGGGGGGSCSGGPKIGGSGGGAAGTYFQFCSPEISLSGANGISGQGNNGGSRSVVTNHCCTTRGAAGGGGAGNLGSSSNSGEVGKNGGNGILNSITGSNVFYAGGGGGGASSFNGGIAGGSGGLGGGGNGGKGRSNSGSVLGTAGNTAVANTGGGGGGGVDGFGGNGGSGIVIVRYAIK